MKAFFQLSQRNTFRRLGEYSAAFAKLMLGRDPQQPLEEQAYGGLGNTLLSHGMNQRHGDSTLGGQSKSDKDAFQQDSHRKKRAECTPSVRLDGETAHEPNVGGNSQDNPQTEQQNDGPKERPQGRRSHPDRGIPNGIKIHHQGLPKTVVCIVAAFNYAGVVLNVL